jgi:hypothetical protein
MPEQHITVQEYQFHRALCEFPEVADEHLCGGKTSHFIAGCMAIVGVYVGLLAFILSAKGM